MPREITACAPAHALPCGKDGLPVQPHGAPKVLIAASTWFAAHPVLSREQIREQAKEQARQAALYARQATIAHQPAPRRRMDPYSVGAAIPFVGLGLLILLSLIMG